MSKTSKTVLQSNRFQSLKKLQCQHPRPLAKNTRWWPLAMCGLQTSMVQYVSVAVSCRGYRIVQNFSHTLTSFHLLRTGITAAKFLALLDKHGRDWVAIQKELGDKTLGQIRSHSQKYFERMLKIGNAEAVPKARAKKRSDKPYPVQSTKKVRLSRADSISTAATAAMSAATDDGRSEASLLTDNISAAAELAANAAMAAMEAVRGGNKKKKAVPPQQPPQPQPLQQQPDFGRVYRILSSAIEGSEKIEDLMKGISDLSPLDSKSFHMLLSNLVCNLERQLDANDLTGAEAGGSRT